MPCPQPDAPAPNASTDACTQVTTCVRCKANPAISIFRDSIYCQSCALAVFDQKTKSGLEYARGAGLAKYVAAAKASTSPSSASASTPSPSGSNAVAQGGQRQAKAINNGGGNAEVNVSANIAIAFSGGPSSRALLRTATQYFRPESSSVTPRNARRRKGRGETAVDTPSEADAEASKPRTAPNGSGRFNEVGKIYAIYIDDSSIIPNGAGVDRTEQARQMVEAENCPDLDFVGLKLEDIYRTSSSPPYFDAASNTVEWTVEDDPDTQRIASTTTPIEDPTAELKKLFSALYPADTPRTGASSARTRVEDLHRILLQTLLRRAAQYYDCSALLLADSATRISIRLIEDLAKGAGHKLPIQGSDAVWMDDLLVIRPLKGHLLQEVLFYTNAHELPEIEPRQEIVPGIVSTKDILEGKAGGKEGVPVMDKSSIARLTETFILNLEKGVASTVTTIGKTGSKLVLNDPSEATSSSSAASSLGGGVANSTAAFQTVGPSVALRSRTTTDAMANLTLSGTSSSAVAKVEEPRIGSRGIKLAQNSASCFHWSTRFGMCALWDAVPTSEGEILEEGNHHLESRRNSARATLKQ